MTFKQLYERRDFASAQEKYEALTAAERGTDQLQQALSNYTATDHLSEIEAVIFDIDPALIADLFWAYERYLNLIGACDEYFYEHRKQERINHARFLHARDGNDISCAVTFMTQVCGLSATQSFGWVLKVTAAELRGGLFCDADEEDDDAN